MRKRTMIGALLSTLAVLALWSGRAAAQHQTLQPGSAVLPGASHEPFRNVPSGRGAPGAAKANTLKKVTDFLTTPIVQVAAFAGVKQTATKPAYQVRREQMYQQRRQLHRDEMMKMRSPR